MCGRASLLSISGVQEARCGCSVSVCEGGGLTVSLKLLHGGCGQPHQGLAEKEDGCAQAVGTCSILLAVWGNPSASLAAAHPLSSHAQHSERD